MTTIAIIEDDTYIGSLLEEALTQEGYRVVRAYSGTEALLLLERKKPERPPFQFMENLIKSTF